jgi:hypothetical protein
MISEAIETCCRSIQRRSHAERHREGERNADASSSRAPLPEPDERDQHHQGNRFPQAVHEQVDILLHLERLIGGARNDQVGREPVAQDGKGRIHRLAEDADLLSRPHLEREGDRPPVPLPAESPQLYWLR